MATMEITTRIGCFINCVYCPQKKLIEAYSKRSDRYQMTLDVFKKCLDKIPENVIIAFGGMSEAWLNLETPKMVCYAHEKKHRICIYTTLMGMRLEDVVLIKSIRPDSFVVHLPSEDKYENILVNDLYMSLLEEIFKTDINDIEVHFYGSSPHKRVKTLLENKGIHYTRRQAHTRCLNLNVGDKKHHERLHGTIRCLGNFDANVLLPNGDVLLCCMDYGIKHCLGNLLSQEYESLLKSDEFLKVTKGLKDESLDILCRYCEEFAYHEKWSFVKPCWESAKKGFLKKSYLYARRKIKGLQ